MAGTDPTDPDDLPSTGGDDGGGSDGGADGGSDSGDPNNTDSGRTNGGAVSGTSGLENGTDNAQNPKGGVCGCASSTCPVGAMIPALIGLFAVCRPRSIKEAERG